MGTSIGAAIDYLVTGLPVPLTVIASDVEVSDNVPSLTAQTLVVIGRESDESGDSVSGDAAYTALGAQRIEETYTLPGYVDVFRPGPAQKPARDAAIGLFDGVVTFVHTDPTLGGLLQRGRIGIVGRLALTQTQDDQDTGGGGYMRATIRFELQIKNTYIP